MPGIIIRGKNIGQHSQPSLRPHPKYAANLDADDDALTRRNVGQPGAGKGRHFFSAAFVVKPHCYAERKSILDWGHRSEEAGDWKLEEQALLDLIGHWNKFGQV